MSESNHHREKKTSDYYVTPHHHQRQSLELVQNTYNLQFVGEKRRLKKEENEGNNEEDERERKAKQIIIIFSNILWKYKQTEKRLGLASYKRERTLKLMYMCMVGRKNKI